MHFDGSKMRTGLGAGIVLMYPKRDQLKYALQIHFAASNNFAEYEALAHGLRLAKVIRIWRILYFADSDLVVHQVSGEWDARDTNMASYRFLIQQPSSPFEGCEFHHVSRVDNKAADTLAKIDSTRQAIPVGVSLEQLYKPSIKPSPELALIFLLADPSVPTMSATPFVSATTTVPATLALPTPIVVPATTASPTTTTTSVTPSLESCWLDT
ncbi:hypothetical protein ZWY2020_025127 [Hordeum vulgare]|nr:hypothetical protein ZWY2020_025127 [Hordeum vulgare]